MRTTHGPQVEGIDQVSVDRPGHDVTSADMSAHPTDTTDTSPVTSVHHVDHTDLPGELIVNIGCRFSVCHSHNAVLQSWTKIYTFLCVHVLVVENVQNG